MSEEFTAKTYGKMTFQLPRLPNYIIRDEMLKVPLSSFSEADIKTIFKRMADAAIKRKREENHEQS